MAGGAAFAAFADRDGVFAGALAGVFFTAAFPGATFFGGAFFAVFFGGAFFAAALRGAFFAGDFLAVVFFGGAFFAVPRLEGAFRAVFRAAFAGREDFAAPRAALRGVFAADVFFVPPAFRAALFRAGAFFAVPFPADPREAFFAPPDFAVDFRAGAFFAAPLRAALPALFRADFVAFFTVFFPAVFLVSPAPRVRADLPAALPLFPRAPLRAAGARTFATRAPSSPCPVRLVSKPACSAIPYLLTCRCPALTGLGCQLRWSTYATSSIDARPSSLTA